MFFFYFFFSIQLIKITRFTELIYIKTNEKNKNKNEKNKNKKIN